MSDEDGGIMSDEKKWRQIYQQEPIIDEEYKFYYDLWYKYELECETYDRMIAPPDGMPKTIEQRNTISKHTREVRKRLMMEGSSEMFRNHKYAKENAQKDVDKFLAGTNAN